MGMDYIFLYMLVIDRFYVGMSKEFFIRIAVTWLQVKSGIGRKSMEWEAYIKVNKLNLSLRAKKFDQPVRITLKI